MFQVITEIFSSNSINLVDWFKWAEALYLTFLIQKDKHLKENSKLRKNFFNVFFFNIYFCRKRNQREVYLIYAEYVSGNPQVICVWNLNWIFVVFTLLYILWTGIWGSKRLISSTNLENGSHPRFFLLTFPHIPPSSIFISSICF